MKLDAGAFVLDGGWVAVWQQAADDGDGAAGEKGAVQFVERAAYQPRRKLPQKRSIFPRAGAS